MTKMMMAIVVISCLLLFTTARVAGMTAPTPTPPNGITMGYEAGDLSGKFGALTDKTALSETFTDTGTDLIFTDVIDRSIVIHKGQGARWVCATIKEVDANNARATFTNFDGVSGTITFTLDAVTPSLPLQIAVALTGLRSLAGGYHIHVNPAVEGMPTQCGDSTTGGHWNPTNVGVVVAPTPKVHAPPLDGELVTDACTVVVGDHTFDFARLKLANFPFSTDTHTYHMNICKDLESGMGGDVCESEGDVAICQTVSY
jgi:Cu/Zn superoxide dismutase